MNLVIDTNNLISGLLWRGLSAQLLWKAEQGKAKIFSSPQLLAEFAEVLGRPKFAARLAASGITADELALKLAEQVSIVSPAMLSLPLELRDPKDLPVLACAVAARADAIISGDNDLLTMGNFQGIRILSARQALDLPELA